MITLAVLAGGEGRRMGGPKDSLRDGGKPVLAALLERVKWGGLTMVVAPHGGRLPVGHDLFDRVVSDSVSGQGPLRGILTALLAAETEIVVCVPVDMPGLGRAHVEWVGKELESRPVLGVMLRRHESGAARTEPFPCAFRIGAAEIMRGRLEAGDLALHTLAEESEVTLVDSPREWGEQVWRNVNVPGDLPRDWQRTGE